MGEEMKKIIFLVFILFLFFGCAANKAQQSVLASYETGSTTIEGLHQTMASMCDAKMINGKDCNRMVASYAKVKAANYEVGEVAKIVGKAAEAVQIKVAECKAKNDKKCDLTNLNLIYQSALSLYQKVSADFIKIFNDFVSLSKQFGVISGGAK
jgi:predicted nucleic acid-binding protein